MTSIRTVRGTLPGLPGEHDIAVLEGDTHISKWVEQARRLDHDQNALPVIGKLIGPESVVYDVGAMIGDHAAFYACLAKWVIAVEPFGDAYDCLIHNTTLYKNVTPVYAAIGDGSRFVYRDYYEENAGARSLVHNPNGSLSWTIDDLVKKAFHEHPPTFIKLDIEGWEVRALRGAERTLRTYHPTLVVEVNREALERAGTSPHELHDMLRGHGYEMTDLFSGMGWFPDDPCDQFDVVCR